MTQHRNYTVACLAGHGIGPELMAEASRAVTRVSRLHGFRVDELHRPFGAEALTQSGHALPAATREATLGAHAILLAAAGEPAIAGVESELDLRARVHRVVYGPRGEVTVLSPLDETALEWTVARAFESARASHGRVTAVGLADAEGVLAAAADRHDCVVVEHLASADAVRQLALEPERFDVVLASDLFAQALVDVAASGRSPRMVASGRLASNGPGVFAPGHGAAEDIAGQGVANPAWMLLTTALMLGEGLGERRAAETLTGAVLEACSNGVRTPDMLRSGVGATTRQFADVVLSALPFTLTNAEFYREAVA